MFEVAELGRKIRKAEFKKRELPLRTELLQEQQAFKKKPFPLIIVIEGIDNTVKGELVNRLNEWFDTRGLQFIAFGAKSDEEAERPRFWRYWRSLPEAGDIGIFSGSWYTGTLYQKTFKGINKFAFDQHMKRILNLETMLAEEGAVILKFWLHISEKNQRKRLKSLSKDKDTRWKVSKLDRRLSSKFKKFIKSAERAVRLTDTPIAPWMIIEAQDIYYRDLTVAETILAALRNQNSADTAAAPANVMVQPAIVDTAHTSLLDNIDLSQSLDKKRYETLLKKRLAELNQLSWEAYHHQRSLVVVFEGWDAAGKGGAIRRLTRGIDARISRVIQVAAPTDEEKAHHYLWRFWRHLPRGGHVTIYDRSWYGRVLVERVENFASEEQWRRAYFEINDFEEQLCDHGIILVKFWVHIDQDEQLQRFEAREQTPHKRYKITDEDWRNREKWPEYEQAANDIFARTSTEYAPWNIVPANDKRFARINVLDTVCERIRKALHD